MHASAQEDSSLHVDACMCVCVCVSRSESSPFLVTHPAVFESVLGVLCKAVHWCDVERVTVCVILCCLLLV